MTTRTEAITNFLNARTHPDLAALYNYDMEVQVLVAQDGGERINGEYQGRKWHGWTDGIQVWKPFRVPYNAGTKPEFTDSEIKFDLDAHAEGIGMTGWDWVKRCSRWVAFDFDAIVGHSERHNAKLSVEQLQEVESKAKEIPWISVRRSAGGKGLHLYVFLDPVVDTANHHEHAALARSILGTLSAMTGFDFDSKVDICGGNMWVWHRKMQSSNGLTLVKQGEPLDNVPVNWRDHLEVVKGKSRRNLPSFVKETGVELDIFDQLCGTQSNVPLDDDHKKLLTFLQSNESFAWWDQDRHMLVCHSHDLKVAHDELHLKGIFHTLAQGTESGQDQNCYAFPLRAGAWVVRRHTKGVAEHTTWDQDASGWTRCFYNQEPDLKTACQAFGAIEDPKTGQFVFREAEMAIEAAKALGKTISLPASMGIHRTTKLSVHKSGRLVCEIDATPHDDAKSLQGWLAKKDKWIKVFDGRIENRKDDLEVENYDDLIRHVVVESSRADYGWLIRSMGAWNEEPLTHINAALKAMGLNPKELSGVVGKAVVQCWLLVNRPFQPEYPGDRQWNRNAAQLRFTPSQEENLTYPTWLKLLDHCGEGLNEAISTNKWCKENAVKTGSDYLKIWVASMFQEPEQPLPYLFFYSPEQNTGKSSFHEALSLLMTRGYQRADNALISQSGFNGELESTVLCVVEETDLKKNKTASNRIKDWVTGRQINIHKKQNTPYHVINTTHWVQCSNDYDACPMFPGDTRIVMIRVPALKEMIPKRDLIPLLEKEAANFLGAVMRLELPRSNDRLNVPVIETAEKSAAIESNKTSLQLFIEKFTYNVPGETIEFAEFYDRYLEYLDVSEVGDWSKKRTSQEFPPHYPKGGATWAKNKLHVGNISWENKEASGIKLHVNNGVMTKL